MAEYKLQANINIGGELININGDNPEEFEQMVLGFATKAPSLAQAITTAKQAFSASSAFSHGQQAATGQVQQAVPGAPPAPYQPPAQQATYTQPAPQQPPTGYNPPPPAQSQGTPPPAAGMVCAHGPRKWAQGTNKRTGAPYSGWYCNAPYGTPANMKCPPLDANGQPLPPRS